MLLTNSYPALAWIVRVTESSLFHKPGYSIFLIIRTLFLMSNTISFLCNFFCLRVRTWSFATYLCFKVSLYISPEISIPTQKSPQFPFRKSYLFRGVWFSEEKNLCACLPLWKQRANLSFPRPHKTSVSMCPRFGQLSLQFFNLKRMWHELKKKVRHHSAQR